MPVLRGNEARSMLREAVVLDLGDVVQQAARIEAAARAKAERLLAEASEQAERLRAEAVDQGRAAGHVEGHAQGHAQGLEEGRQQGHDEAFEQAKQSFDSIQKQWLRAADTWETCCHEVDTDWTEAVVELSLRLAEKLVHRAIETDRSAVMHQLVSVLRQITGVDDIQVRICPEDRAFLEEVMPDLLARFSKLRHAELVDDPSLTRGGCVVTFAHGEIDATLETQLRNAVDLLLPGGFDMPETVEEVTE